MINKVRPETSSLRVHEIVIRVERVLGVDIVSHGAWARLRSTRVGKALKLLIIPGDTIAPVRKLVSS